MWNRLLLLALVCVPTLAFSCKPELRPYVKFDPDEHVFYGEVVGYVSQKETCLHRAQTRRECVHPWGLKFAVLETVSSPRPATRYSESYAYRVGGDCSRIPISEAEVRSTPIGSRFMVVERIERNSGSDNTTVISVRDWTTSFMVPVSQDADIASLRVRQEDYSEYFRKQITPEARQRRLALIFKPYDAEYEREEHSAWLSLYFELRKDMVRLEETGSDYVKRDVLLRLAKFQPFTSPDPRTGAIPFDDLVRRNIRDTALQAQILSTRR